MNRIKDLLSKFFGERKPNCFGYLTHPQMYAENECYSCEWLEQCDKASGERWKD